jgi:predicted ATPase
MQKWKFLALEPSSMRRPDRFYTDPYINANGGHIPATLNRIIEEAEENGTTKDDVLSEIVARISRLVPIRKIAIDADEVRQTFTLMAEESGGVSIPAFSLSDGTLRFLTLAVLASDPKSQDLICLEEPENGIHPAKINLILKLLKELSVDPDQQPGPDNPFRQIIIATHSPSFVQLQSKNDLVYAKEALVKTSNGTFRTLRCCALEGSWRVDSGIQKIGMASIVNYLAAPEGAQLQLPNID